MILWRDIDDWLEVVKILYFYQKFNKNNDMIWGLLELGFEPRLADYVVPDAEYDEKDLEQTCVAITGEELIVTQDFSAVVAEACRRKGRIYLSYVYDSPQRALFMKEAKYENNIVFVFDKRQVERLRASGLKNLYYEPLCSNVKRVSAINISNEDIIKYAADISFVGNLYFDQQRSAALRTLSELVRRKTEHMLERATGNWEGIRAIYEPLDPDVKKMLMDLISVRGLAKYDIDGEYLVQSLLLARELAYRDRISTLNSVARYFDTVLYTGDVSAAETALKQVRICPGVKYETEMPKVFYSSKINLNITLASIESGVPIRVFDILAVGGFVMTNAQEEAGEIFEVGKEIEVFRDLDELIDKSTYYLTHEAERMRIAINGYRRVAKEYTYANALSRMFNIVQENFGIRLCE